MPLDDNVSSFVFLNENRSIREATNSHEIKLNRKNGHFKPEEIQLISIQSNLKKIKPYITDLNNRAWTSKITETISKQAMPVTFAHAEVFDCKKILKKE